MAQSLNKDDRYAIIAGNGTFPFLVLDAARAEGIEPLVVAIQEEASPDLSSKSANTRWISLGEVSKFFELLKSERVNKVVLAGQVKHAQLFSNIKPDGLMNRALAGLTRKNTNALIGAFVHMLSRQGIEVVDSTKFLKSILAGEGPLTTRRPDESELEDVAYGREIAKKIAGIDIGQTIVVAERACVAIEAMEGTDATIERAASLSNGRRLIVVKVSKPRQDMRFDVPVVGPRTVQVMKRANALTLAVDAGKTLLFEKPRLLDDANAAGIAIVGMRN